MRTQVKADLMLVLVTFFWGISYLLTDLALGELGPFTLNALRFLIAFAAAGLFVFPAAALAQPCHVEAEPVYRGGSAKHLLL